MSDGTLPCSYLLRVSFDADQLGNQLVWAITDAQPDEPNAFQRTGWAAGGLQFLQGDTLGFEVVGYGDPATFAGFAITDATLITLPAPYLRPLFSPSPFDCDQATFDLDDFKPTSCTVAQNLKICTAISPEILPVVEPQGIWKFSFVVTVQISRVDGCVETRVFSFDPMIAVGKDWP